MSELERIFKNRPDLLENRQVKDFINYVQGVHNKNMAVAERAINKVSDIHQALIYSNRYLKDGHSDKDTIDVIEEIISKD